LKGVGCCAEFTDPNVGSPRPTTTAMMTVLSGLGMMVGRYWAPAAAIGTAFATGNTLSAAVEAVGAAKKLLASAKAEEDRNDMQANVNPYTPDFAFGRTGLTVHCLPYGFSLPIDSVSFGDLSEMHSILEFARSPGMIAYGAGAQGTTLTFPVFADPKCEALSSQGNCSNYAVIPMAYLGQLFKYWRGSIKFAFYFFGSAMISARVRFKVFNSTSGDAVFRTMQPDVEFTVKGTTMYSMSIPFVNFADWLLFNDFEPSKFQIPYVLMSFVVVSTSGDSTTPSIPYMVYMSAGEDFEVRFPITTVGAASEFTSVRGMGCSAFYPCEDFRTPFEPMPGLVKGNSRYQLEPEIGSFEALLSRWSLSHYYGNATGGIDIRNTTPALGQFSGTTPFSDITEAWNNREIIGSLFMWWSGDLDYRIIYRQLAASGTTGGAFPGDMGIVTWGAEGNDTTEIVSYLFPDNGLSLQSIDHWSNQQISVPSISTIAVWPTVMMGKTFGVTDQSVYNSYLPEPIHSAISSASMGLHTSIDLVFQEWEELSLNALSSAACLYLLDNQSNVDAASSFS